jgi:glucosamine--fructose-6-phosphate aminotransferase (isomerizing)
MQQSVVVDWTSPAEGYLGNVLEQPTALSRFLDSAPGLAESVRGIDLADRPRVILSGMGSSHWATFSAWQMLAAAGLPVWWVDTAQLLDVAGGLIVPGSLVWLTSQSGESAETVALLDTLNLSDVHVLGVTNAPDSTLGRRADSRIDLLAGDEVSVSSKSFLNTVAASALVVGEYMGQTQDVVGCLRRTVDRAAQFLNELDAHVRTASTTFASDQHILLTGRGTAAASASAAGLIIKEAAKVPVEGMSAGALRHGPIELAGPGLNVTFFDHGSGSHHDQNVRLAEDLAAAGSSVAWVSDDAPAGATRLPAPDADGIDLTIRDALAFQTISFALAQRKGIPAGTFSVASKVTDIL